MHLNQSLKINKTKYFDIKMYLLYIFGLLQYEIQTSGVHDKLTTNEYE